MSIIERGRNGNIKVHKSSRSKQWLNLVLLVLVIVTVYGFITIDTKNTDLGKAAVDTLRYFKTMFFEPRGVPSHFGASGEGSWAVLLAGLRVVLVTLSLALLTTIVGSVIALVLALFAARNITNERTSYIIKGFVAVIRAIPTVLWVLIFAIGAGLGSVAAVIGMSFHTIGYLMKAYSESFEELEPGVLEALRAAGGNWFHVVFQAILPSSITYILSWTFIRFEINFAVAVAMGAAAGAGGIGYQLYMAAGYFYDIREIGYITYLILAVALIMEIIATRLKKQYQLHE